MDDLLAGMSVFAVAIAAGRYAENAIRQRSKVATRVGGVGSSLRQRTLRLPEWNFSGFYVRVARYLFWIAIEKARR